MMEVSEREVRETHEKWIEAVNAGRLEVLLTMLADDVVLLNPDGEPMRRDAFVEKFSGATKEFAIRCRSELEEVVVAGDVAYTRSRDSLTVTPRAGGETARLAGYRMTIDRRAADGRWLLARDMHGVAPVEG